MRAIWGVVLVAVLSGGAAAQERPNSEQLRRLQEQRQREEDRKAEEARRNTAKRPDAAKPQEAKPQDDEKKRAEETARKKAEEARLRADAARIDTTSDALRMARGRYLIENVAGCQDCHSARNPLGEFDRTRWLQGGRVPYKAGKPVAAEFWAEVAPPLAGLPDPYDQVRIMTVLVTGRRPDGTPPNAPMPQYHFTREDAEAAVTYLKSLPGP